MGSQPKRKQNRLRRTPKFNSLDGRSRWVLGSNGAENRSKEPVVRLTSRNRKNRTLGNENGSEGSEFSAFHPPIHLRKNDALVIGKLDRLGRTVRGLVDLVGELERRSVRFQSLTDGINTKTPAGRLCFHVMASLAQMERELLVERTRAGLVAAKKLGRVGGRKRRMTDSKIQSGKTLLISGVSPKEVGAQSGSFYSDALPLVPASERS